MNDLIVDKYSKLPKEMQSQVLDYIDFLVAKYQEKLKQESHQNKISNFGSAKGLIVISDDFDDSLSLLMTSQIVWK